MFADKTIHPSQNCYAKLALILKSLRDLPQSSIVLPSIPALAGPLRHLTISTTLHASHQPTRHILWKRPSYYGFLHPSNLAKSFQYKQVASSVARFPDFHLQAVSSTKGTGYLILAPVWINVQSYANMPMTNKRDIARCKDGIRRMRVIRQGGQEGWVSAETSRVEMVNAFVMNAAGYPKYRR